MPNPAATFANVDWGLKMISARPSSRPALELLSCHRAWAATTPELLPSATEPSEKTHVFFFAWKTPSAELKVKDQSSLKIKGGAAGDEWEIGTFLPGQNRWEECFIKMQKEWEERGMRARSLHLTF